MSSLFVGIALYIKDTAFTNILWWSILEQMTNSETSTVTQLAFPFRIRLIHSQSPSRGYYYLIVYFVVNFPTTKKFLSFDFFRSSAILNLWPPMLRLFTWLYLCVCVRHNNSFCSLDLPVTSPKPDFRWSPLLFANFAFSLFVRGFSNSSPFRLTEFTTSWFSHVFQVSFWIVVSHFLHCSMFAPVDLWAYSKNILSSCNSILIRYFRNLTVL